MPKNVEFYYDFGSPTSYLAYKRLPELCKKHNAELVLKPVLLGGIFKATNNVPPGAVPAKGRYMLNDMARFARRHDIKMRFNPNFPLNTLTLMRCAFAAITMNKIDEYNQVVFNAVWVAEKNMGDLDILKATLDDANLPTEYAAFYRSGRGIFEGGFHHLGLCTFQQFFGGQIGVIKRGF